MSARALPFLFSLLLAASAGCVSTDEPGPDAGWMDFEADMDAADGSMERDQDVTGQDMGDQGSVEADMDAVDMPAPDMGGACQPNFDGRIDRAEIPIRARLDAKFAIAEDVAVDLRGQSEAGKRSWDFSMSLPQDELTLVSTEDPSGKWWATDFPQATYASRLVADDDLRGVFQITDDALLLLGVVSPEDGFGSTKLTYDPPVPILKFPLEEGGTWSTETSISGRNAFSAVVFYDETYTSVVDASGSLKTPFGTFDQILRVRTDLTREIGLITTDTITYLFISECFGTVASARSEDNEDQGEFEQAAELRRLTR